jgi:N-acetyl sugar amidotransferase
MDTSAEGITFDADGVCNYCTDFLAQKDRFIVLDPVKRAQKRDALVERVKRDGKGKPYDCIVGVSGGVDSSWVLYQAVQHGLRPLAVHMDSGWNAELAQNNIANLVRQLGVDLHTHVINWAEIRGLMEAFFASDVIDVEVLYDNAMIATNYQAAVRNRIKHIIAGTNVATEGMRMPRNWNWLKHDKRNIVGISKQFGGPRLKTFPAISTLDFVRYLTVHHIKWISFLDYFDYKKSEALEVLTRDFGYKPYAYKHYESIFTRFYQGYILPNKFGVDKRRLHLSNLVVMGEMTRDEALASAAGIAYPSEADLEADKQYFIKKMGWTEAKLADYIARPERPHTDYPSEAGFYYWALDMYRKMKLSAGKVT